MHTLEHQVLAYIKEQQLIKSGDKLLIACSGGVDSMALLSFFIIFSTILILSSPLRMLTICFAANNLLKTANLLSRHVKTGLFLFIAVRFRLRKSKKRRRKHAGDLPEGTLSFL